MTNQISILIVDDEESVRDSLYNWFVDDGYQVECAENAKQALSMLDEKNFDIVLADIKMPGMDGMEMHRRIRALGREPVVIIMTAFASVDTAVQALKDGAFDYVTKPFDPDDLSHLIRNAATQVALKAENLSLKEKITSLVDVEDIVGESAPLRKVLEEVERVANSNSSVIITGESGTGKELVARAIHMKSKRVFGPFIEVNCAAIPDTLIESELFGHEKGAFTNAFARRKGKFELAHKGSLFLDEIADLSLSAQAKVLRVIQELAFERIGGEEQISVDVRLIAATNKNIEEEIKTGRFREDLYFRLNVIPIFIPPLRERIEDLDELISYFMKKYKHPKYAESKKISPEALKILKSYHWPGNIRELKNFMERINIMTEEQYILPATVNQYLGAKEKDKKDSFLYDFSDMKLNEAKDHFEKELIVQKLKDNEYNISKTAQILGLYPSNLHNKIKKLGIKIER